MTFNYTTQSRNYKNGISIIKIFTVCTLFCPMTGFTSAQDSFPECQGGNLLEWSDCLGAVTFASGEKYVGEFKNGKAHGRGTQTLRFGDKYVGKFKDGKYRGQGTYFYSSGEKYVGQFRDGEINGKGEYYAANGSLLQAGIWAKNVLISSTKQDVQSNINQKNNAIIAEENIRSATHKCEELGFKRGTEKFGDCVLKISK